MGRHCDCRGAFATEKIHKLEGVEHFEFSVCNMFFIEGFPGINDCPYRIKRIGLCLVLLIFCQTKSDCQHRFTNHPVQLFFSDIESRDSISASALSETFYPVWTIIGYN